MDEKDYRIAVASSDGIVVNNHFGRARAFYIYELKGSVPEAVDIRNLPPVCEMGDHDESRLQDNLEKLSDCTHLLVSRIGDAAREKAEQYGIRCYEIPGEIPESIDKMIRYEKVNELFN